MNKIRPNLWIGDDLATASHGALDALKGAGITAVLNVADNATDVESNVIRMCKVGLTEAPSPANRHEDVQAASLLLLNLLSAGHVVYVHCVAGVCRAPYIAALVLESIEKRTFESSLAEIAKVRPQIMIPNHMATWYGTEF